MKFDSVTLLNSVTHCEALACLVEHNQELKKDTHDLQQLQVSLVLMVMCCHLGEAYLIALPIIVM